MATEADNPDPISLLKREVEDKEMTSELPNITVSEGPKEEKKKIESWLSQPPEITDFFGKTETEEVGNDDEVENTNVINKGSVETVEGDVFSKSLSVADEKSVRYTEHSQMTSEGRKSKTLADSVSMEKDPETTQPTIDMVEAKNKHGSSLLDGPVEEASQETVELTKEMKDSTSVEDELPHNNPEPSFFKKMGEFFFHKVDNHDTSPKESESGTKDFVKESQHEAERENEMEIVGEKQKDEAIIADDINKNEVQEANNLPTVDLDAEEVQADSEKQNEVSMSESGDPQEAIQFPNKVEKHVNKTSEATESPESTISEHTAAEGDLNREETSTSEMDTNTEKGCELKSEETLKEINAEDNMEEEREKIEEALDTEFFVERKSDNGRSTIEETKDSTSVEDELPHKNPKPSFFKKMGEFFFHKVDNLETSEEIETKGSSKDAEMITNIEEQRPVGSPEEIVRKKQKDEAIIADDINKNEVQEANNLPTVDLDERTRSAELEVPNKSGSELGIAHPPEEEEVHADREKHMDVSMSESGNPQEATESPGSTISEHAAAEGELNIEETSTSEMDINTEKCCELKSEETLKEINTEDNAEEEREQIDKSSDTEFLAERKSDDDGRSTIEEDIPVKKGEEECHHDHEEQVRSSNSFPEELTETVCEDPKMADRAEDMEKEMENEENTITDFSPEPLGESTTKKHEVEASKGYDTYGEITTLEESAITDLPSSDVREDKAEESLKEDRRGAMIPDKEVWDSNIESRERDSEATHSIEESTTKDLKDEAEANEGLNAQSMIGSSEEETAQESDSNHVQTSSVPEIIEKEVNKEFLEKEESKVAVEAEETRSTETESEYPMAADSSNLIAEGKGQVTTETSEMRSNDRDIIAESAEISILGDKEDMEIPTARKDGADESTEKTQPEDKNKTCDELSKPEDQREISTVEASSEYMPEQEHLESSTMPLEAHNLVTGVSETTGKVLEKEKTLSDKEETPLVAETTEEHIAETKGDSTNQENDTKMGSIDIGKESTIDDDLVRELHAPPELDYGKSISEPDVELLKGVNTGEAANDSNMSELETSNDENSSHVGVETDKSEFEEAVNEASQGFEVGGGCIETENDILEQENSAKNYGGSLKEGVEIEKASVEFKSEAYDCGSVATEAQRISTQTEKKIDVEDKELASELPNVTVNEVPLQEKENTESWLSQPPESIETPEPECVQVAHNDEVGNVNVVNVGTTEGESFLKSTSVADEELIENTKDNQLNTKEEMIGFQEEEGKGEMITDENFMAEASYGQDGVRIQTPELLGGSSRDIEVLNDVLCEGNMEKITSTEATSVEQDLKETSFEGEDEKSNALEMDPEATQPSTDIGEEKNKGEEMQTAICGEEIDIAPTVVPDLSSLGEVQLNDEPVKALDASSDAESLQATKTAEAGEQELEETSIIESQFPIQEHENADNANRHVEKSDANEVEVEATEIPYSESLSEDQAVKEIHKMGSSLSVIEPDTKETEAQTREVPEVSLEPTDAARDDEITPGQTPQPEKTEEYLQEPSSGLLSEEQESETTTGIAKGSTNKDAMEEEKMRQAEVSMVLETNHGDQDTDEPVKALVTTSSDTGSLQTTERSDARQLELDETSSVVSQFPVDEHEKSENVRVHVDKLDTYDVEEKELEIPGAVPEPTDQRVQEIQETGASLPVGEAHAVETAYQTREVPEAFSKAKKQGVEPVSGDEIIAPAVATEVRSLEEVQLNEHMEALDTPSSAENLDTIKTADASQQDAEFENMKLEETCIMVSQPPIHEHEEEDRENIPLEKLEANVVQVEETKIPDTVPESEDQAGKELGKPISEVPEALLKEMNQGVDAARNDEITPSQILQSEKLEEQLDAPSSGLLSKEQESETTITDKKGSTDRDDIEGTKMLQAEIREELETTGEGKGIGNQVQAEEERAQDWSTVSSAEELDTKSSIDNAMITKMSTEGVLQTDHGGHDIDEHVKTLDTSSDTERLQTTQTPDASQQELEETSSMVSQLPVHIYEKADNESVTEENSDACDVEVKEIDLPGVVPESNDQRVKEIHEVGTSVGETRTKEEETPIREVCQTLPEDVNQGGETVGGDEIVSPSEAIEVTSLGELQLNDELVEAPDTNKTGDASQQDAEFDSMKHEETSILVSQLPIHEHVKEESANIPFEKSDANDVEEAEIPDTLPESEDQAVEEIHETGASLTAGEADINETEQIRGVPEALSEPINPCFDTSRDDEMTPVQTLRAEKIEEDLQVPSSTLLSKEEDGETSNEKGSTDKDGTEVGSLELQENSGSVLQLPVTEFNSANDVTEEKSDANEVEPNETKALDVVSDSKDGVFEAIQEIRTIPAAEDTETEKVEDEIKEVTQKIPDLRYKGVDAATDGENLDHPLPVDKLDEQIQLSSSSYESAKEEAAELDNSELEKATDMSSKLPTIEHGIHHVGTTIEKSEADEVLVEEAKTSEAISESKGDVFEEFKEIGSSPPVEKICTDEVQEETKAVPETIFEPTNQGAQTAINAETAIDQTLTPQGVEQLHEPKSTTEKPCLQDEGQRELEVSNLELKLEKDSQDISPDEENTGLEKCSTDAPSQYEERPVQQSSKEASTDEDIDYSKNENKDADNLPTPYPTVTEHSTEDIGGKYEEVSNLEFEKNGEVLLESVPAVKSPVVHLTSEGIEVIEETPKESTTEEEAIEKYTSAEKISEEMQGSRNFDHLSLQEETATKTNQEDELRAEDYPGERTSTIFDASRNEIQHEAVFKESEEDCVDKNMEGLVRADDNGPHQVSAPDEIANQSELESQGDVTDFTDTAKGATAQIEELKSSEAMLVRHEVERTGKDDEETAISKDGQLQNTDLVVPAVPDTAAEEALDGKELETFDDFSERALDPTHQIMEPYEHKKEIATAGTINSESLVDNEKLGYTFPEPGCEGSGGTEDLDLTKKDGSNKPSFLSTTATLQETLADEECEKAVDTKQHHFMSDKPTAEPESIPKEGNGFQLEGHTMDKEPVELSVMADEAKLDENKIRTITAIEEEESPRENEKPNVLPDTMDSEMGLSREAVTMNISEDIQGLEKTSLAIPHEQIASKTDPSESRERTNSKGMECGEEKRMGEQSEEITAQSEMTESAKMSLSDLLQRSTKRSMQGVEDVTEERELKRNKEEPQNETAETVEAEEEAVHDKKDEEEEGDELKREDSGSDAPVMVEASRDMDDKIAHKKAHHHNILSGVGSKVKHSLAKVKKAITGKSSHPKPTSPK